MAKGPLPPRNKLLEYESDMTRAHRLTLAGLLSLVGAAVVGLILTGGSAWWEKPTPDSSLSSAARALAGEQQLLDTAQRLTPLAVSAKERELARNAVRLADQEVDLAFSQALRDAAEQPGAPNSSARALQAQVAELNAQVTTLQGRVKNLTEEQTHAKGLRLAALQEQVELAQAELALDQDSLADAQQDLARTGGDVYGDIQRLWQQHEAADHAKEGAPVAANPSPAATAPTGSSVIAQWRNWQAVRAGYAQLLQARQEALNATSALDREHAALEKQAENSRRKNEPLLHPAAGVQGSSQPAGSQIDTAAHVALLHRLSIREKDLADLNRRILDLRELTGIYDQWSSVAKGRGRAALHNLILSALYILLTVLAVWLASRLTEHTFSRIGLERRQLITLRGVVQFSVEALGIAAVLLVIFGVPGNLSTVLGLAGAGLTVVLKDFIVSFIGWFSLMGRRGIRVGDWVEINGVRGEVIEIDLLRTVLLETGNWTEPGHPTGRQVTFLNSYAVEGYYFNFTTAGQWLWDEITLHVPWGVDPYPVIEQIERLVAAETASNAQAAEQEWQRATHGYGVKAFSAASAINVRSKVEGVEVTVRYITRANERYAMRLRLSNAAVKLIHEAKAAATPSVSPPPKPSPETKPAIPPPGGK